MQETVYIFLQHNYENLEEFCLNGILKKTLNKNKDEFISH